MTRFRFQTLACLALSLISNFHSVSGLTFSSSDWTNVNHVKTIDLGGTVTHALYNLNLQAGQTLSLQEIESDSNPSLNSSQSQSQSQPPSPLQSGYPYILALSNQESAALSSSEVTIKLGSGSNANQRAVLPLLPLPQSHQPISKASKSSLEDNASTSTSKLYAFYLPSHLLPSSKEEELIANVALTLNHVTSPLPKQAEQNGEQKLIWQDDVGLRSIYKTNKGRTKVHSPHPRIISHSILPSPSSSKSSTPSLSEATKSGATLTYGPYEKTSPISLGEGGQGSNHVSQAKVHFVHDIPVVSIVTLDRHVEVSHWGDNLATEDRIWLRNDGPKLKGHFSRIDHQTSAFYSKTNSHVLTNLLLHLPAGAKDAYFIDQIGNVSTSNFKPVPPSPKTITTSTHLLPGSKVSTLEVRPRYPLLGGWNYTFSVGWNSNLGEGGWGKKIGNGRFSLATPFLTPVTDLAVDHVRTRVVLPEGASDIRIETPFEMDSIKEEIFTTYLDSTGRPSIIFEKSKCSEWHGKLIYITYDLSLLAHLRKPLAVAAVSLALFFGAAVLRRWDFNIKATK